VSAGPTSMPKPADFTARGRAIRGSRELGDRTLHALPGNEWRNRRGQDEARDAKAGSVLGKNRWRLRTRLHAPKPAVAAGRVPFSASSRRTPSTPSLSQAEGRA
jgi:hypothetical protein